MCQTHAQYLYSLFHVIIIIILLNLQMKKLRQRSETTCPRSPSHRQQIQMPPPQKLHFKLVIWYSYKNNYSVVLSFLMVIGL